MILLLIFFQLTMIIHFYNDVKDATLLQQNTKTDIWWNRHMVHIREEYGEHFFNFEIRSIS